MLWTVYFDTKFSWKEGRRVSKKISVRGVNAEEIFKAAYDLGMNPVIEAEAKYPRYSWQKAGLVRVDKIYPKSNIINKIARKIRAARTNKKNVEDTD